MEIDLEKFIAVTRKRNENQPLSDGDIEWVNKAFDAVMPRDNDLTSADTDFKLTLLAVEVASTAADFKTSELIPVIRFLFKEVSRLQEQLRLLRN